MIEEKYNCYISDNYIGIMTFLSDGSITMEWQPADRLSSTAKMMKQMTPLKTTEDILAFIGERVGPPEQPGMDIWRSFVGATLQDSNVEVFKKANGVSINDTFHIEKVAK